ncbi:unnamed protein product [Blumeria hordei]|uniref:Nucleoporin NUP37 n=1 Tax=Blumeria hordei TaxID=2867405 RepID=A0A383URU1_BLUHO|nr:unnamed protein product [Blumeria hordei]
MTENITKPRVIKTTQSLLLRYELHERTYAISVYPIKSLNGSTILICGHENGVKIIWRGGKNFKQQAGSNQFTKSNGFVEIASPDTHVDTETFKTTALNDDQELPIETHSTADSYPDITQVLDLSLGISVYHLSVLPASIMRSYKAALDIIVFVAVCADKSLRLISLPLSPPSQASESRPMSQPFFSDSDTNNRRCGESIVILNGHQQVSDGVSMTLELLDGDLNYIIASHSREIDGRLLIWRSPLKEPCIQTEPIQSIYLASPARSISFNPSPNKSNYLLVSETIGVCRIFDYTTPNSTDNTPDILSAAQGSWLLSLYTGFPCSKNSSLPTKSKLSIERKSISDAKWIQNGSAILVLQNDGEWGIWDTETSCSPQGLLGRQGITGGSTTEYSLTGFIDPAVKPHTAGSSQSLISRFAPMTPATRKSFDPFESQPTDSSRNHGQIVTVEIPTNATSDFVDEAILFRLGEACVMIPSMKKYRSSHSHGNTSSGVFGDSSAQIIKLEGLDLQGERCSSATMIFSYEGSPASYTLVPEVLILGEHRFVISRLGNSRVAPAIQRLAIMENPMNKSDLSKTEDLSVGSIAMALEHMEERLGNFRQKQN